MSYRNREACAVPVGAGLPAKQAPRWMAPAAPVFAGAPAPTEARFHPAQMPAPGAAMSYRDREACAVPVGAGLPAKQAPRWMAPASPVFAGAPAPTEARFHPAQMPAPGAAMSYRDREACAVPVGAGLPAKQAPRWMAPASPVFAGAPAPTEARFHSAQMPAPGAAMSYRDREACAVPVGAGLCGPCRSGFTREAGTAVHGTGCAGVRGRARSHRGPVPPRADACPWSGHEFQKP